MQILAYNCYKEQDFMEYINGLVQERCISIANALELCLSCSNPSIWASQNFKIHWSNITPILAPM